MKKWLLTLLFCLSLVANGYATSRTVIVNGDGEEVSDTNNAMKVVGTGTAGTANAGVISVQGIASGTNANIDLNGRATTNSTPINAVTLDADPTSVTSAAITITEYQRVGIFWDYNETEVGGVSGALTIQVSPDNVTYFSAPFFDTAGGATPQTTETLTADGTFICWLDKNIPFSYMKVIVTGTGTDADDTILTSVYVYMDK